MCRVEIVQSILTGIAIFLVLLAHPTTHATHTTALFVFTSKEAAEKFVAGDPYVSNGIVTGHSIAEWSVVVGTN